ncbi:MAG: acyl-ACP--UDP-N-acetylglucosamine O-acyltransferase [Saprospiraceae bacterium]|nr:acyl-ACP--UDP-N-acetylglucosamine O-acyltransferase [Saprospiraceae bacterium]
MDFRKHAVIHAGAQLGENVEIGPFCYIDKDVVIGDGTWIGSNVTIFAGARIGKRCKIMPNSIIAGVPHNMKYKVESNTAEIDDDTWIGSNVTVFEGARIGKSCEIFPGAVIAGIPQDLKFAGEKTTAEIGDRTTIREYVTVNRGTKEAWKTVVGSDCLLMAYAHVAHDCHIGDHVILANNVTLAGHVVIEDWAILEGLVAVQQFMCIGQHSFVAGGSLVRKNVPPYVKAAREPLSYVGVNSVGLTRRKFSESQIHLIHEIYRRLYVSSYNTDQALEIIENEFSPSEERDNILNFVKRFSNDKGIMRGFRGLNGSSVNED